MADTLQAARGLVRELEFRLRELISGAAADGRYEEVARLAELTNQVGALVPAAAVSPAHPNAANAAAEAVLNVRESRGSARRGSGAKKTTSRASDYPSFCRQGDSLVKVGWSASTKREYEHRVPKSGVDALVKYLVGRRANQFPLSVEAMVEALRGEENAEILGYQVYVVVAWLKREGWLAANGRHGYTLQRPKGVAVTSIVDELWAQLPAHS